MNVRFLFRAILFLLILHFTFYILHSHIYAKDPTSFYKTTYEFTTGGVTKVYQEISIVNVASDYYVSEYALSLIGGNITKIEAYDSVGPVQVKKTVYGETSTVTLKFNEKVVGKDKVLSFILKYNVSDFVKKEGNLWRITVPKLGNGKDIDSYQIILKVPVLMGKAAYMSPLPYETSTQDGFNIFSFKKEDVESLGILATFGSYQTFDFTFKYELKNPSLTKKNYQIAIPPDTNYQEVFYNFIDPEPLDVTVDKDGNWLALYTLLPNEELNISVSGVVNIFSLPKSDPVNKNDDINDYLKPQNAWQTNNEKIKSIASELKTPEKIYEYVVNTLEYNENRISKKPERKGAVATLENPNDSLCTEFTDLFIALCRAAKIPSRELQGFAFTDNTKLKEFSEDNDLLHSWPEYYDDKKGEWIMVDPTWENTTGGLDFFNKLDMTHFVFVIHGKSDVYPLPAGSYRFEEESFGKQIFVFFGKDKEIIKKSKFTVIDINPVKLYSLKSSSVSITFKNIGNSASYFEKVVFNFKDISPQKIVNFNVVPPFGLAKHQLTLKPKELLKDYEFTANFKIKDDDLSVTFKVVSVLLRAVIAGGILLTLFLFVILIGLRKRLFEIKQNGNLNKEEDK